MRTKSLFFTAVIAMLAIFTSSCEKDGSTDLNTPAPLTFTILLVDDNGKYLVNADNTEWVKENITITYNNDTYYLNAENQYTMPFYTYERIPNALYFGLFFGNNFNGEFTINYNDGTHDRIAFDVKNYISSNRSIKIYLNGDKIKNKNITIVKPADFLEKMQNAE